MLTKKKELKNPNGNHQILLVLLLMRVVTGWVVANITIISKVFSCQERLPKQTRKLGKNLQQWDRHSLKNKVIHWIRISILMKWVSIISTCLKAKIKNKTYPRNKAEGEHQKENESCPSHLVLSTFPLISENPSPSISQ